MFLNPALSSALDRIAERATDVRRAFIPGSTPQNDDVATGRPASEPTLDPLSVAAPSDAYFVTLDSAGQISYTRNGSFHITDGKLVGADGRPILGFRSGKGELGELAVDPIDAALDRAIDVRVEADGTLRYNRVTIDPRSGSRETERLIAGRIALARFPGATTLQSVNGQSFCAPAGVAPQVGVASEGGFAPLQPMRRQRSGVDLDESLARLKAAYVTFDALAAAETAKGRFGKTALDLIK
jgi:flagellar basal body rod protein FlgG